MRRKSLSWLAIICTLAVLALNFNVKTTIASEYKGRVFYEVFVRSFSDSNNDGIGDIKGITQKLDYLKDLGVKGIWVMPINPSPSYHGYDVTDYYNINPQYGTMNDFKELITEAHKRDINVIMDLVINHTSDQHPWFQQALKDKSSIYRDYYNWANKNTDLNEPSPFGGDKPWTKTSDGKDYYYALFWKGMPDLNYDDKEVRMETKRIAKYYLDMGLDGFRLDAAKWIYTNDVKRNVQWWKEFNTYVKSVNNDAILVGEVWEDDPLYIAPYINGLDSCFDFPLSDQIIKGLTSSSSMKDATLSINKIYNKYKKVNSNYVDSPFLTNHDMNRIMSVLNNDEEKAKKAAAILLTLPGTPYLYYGEETGMTGVKPDEALREPFIWDNKDESKNTHWEPIKNDVNKVAVNLQDKDPNSMLNFYRNIIALRNNSDALKYGKFEVIDVKNKDIMAYKRKYKGDSIYIYINAAKNRKVENIDIDTAKVLYSNKRDNTSLNLNGKLELNDGEILILQRTV